MRLLLILTIILFEVGYLNAQPVLFVENDSQVNWGRVNPNDSPLKADLKLYNKGDKTLEIVSVKPGCSCTTAPLDKTKIEPGDSTTMKITLDVGKYNGKQIHKTITITTNESVNPVKLVDLNALVINSVTFFPTSSIKLGLVKLGTESVVKIVMTNETGHDIKIKDMEISPSNLSVNIKKNTVLPAGKDFELVVKFKPKVVGHINPIIRLTTDDKAMPEILLRGGGKAIM